jgi:hypothetical protein
MEADVDCAVGAFGFGVWVIGAWVGRIVLRDGGQVSDGVGEGVCTTEGENHAAWRWWVGEGDVAAGVGEEGAGVPGLM